MEAVNIRATWTWLSAPLAPQLPTCLWWTTGASHTLTHCHSIQGTPKVCLLMFLSLPTLYEFSYHENPILLLLKALPFIVDFSFKGTRHYQYIPSTASPPGSMMFHPTSPKGTRSLLQVHKVRQTLDFLCSTCMCRIEECQAKRGESFDIVHYIF